MIEFAPVSYQLAYLCKIRESGLIDDEEFEKVKDFLIGKYN